MCFAYKDDAAPTKLPFTSLTVTLLQVPLSSPASHSAFVRHSPVCSGPPPLSLPARFFLQVRVQRPSCDSLDRLLPSSLPCFAVS